MKPDEYRKHLTRLGLTQVGAAKFLRIGERTSRRFASDTETPFAIDLLFGLMLKHKFSPEEVYRILKIK